MPESSPHRSKVRAPLKSSNTPKWSFGMTLHFPSDALLHEIPHRRVRQVGGQIEQPVEGCPGVAPSVPAKCELVEAAPQVLFAHAMQRATEPALQVGERAVNPRKQDVRRHIADYFASNSKSIPPRDFRPRFVFQFLAAVLR